MRPGNMGIAAGGVVLGSLCTSPILSEAQTLGGALLLALIAGIGNIENDWIDLDTDRINRPDRPLPSGSVTVFQAKSFAATLFVVALCIAFLQNALLFSGALFLLLSFYNRFAKATPFLGNITVALLCASAVYYPSLHSTPQPELFFACFFAFLFTLLREVVKDLEDLPGDKKNALKTTAVALGERLTYQTIILLSTLSLASLSLPFFLNWFSQYFQWAALLLLLPLFLKETLRFSRGKTDSSSYSRAIKRVMFIGMISIITDLLINPL